ncbi:MAG: Gfo/Idh/MocA family oxidoreductase [bacterium]
MMKKIGFIDYFIDEWHANNYPKMIRESSLKDKFDVSLAWEEITPEGKKNLDQWCQEQQVGKAASIEQVVEECDCIIVLSPDNAERHEDLADLPLRSGKPVYIDKPIAPSLAAASRLFAKAQRYGTPMMSSSALRFGSALQKALDEESKGTKGQFRLRQRRRGISYICHSSAGDAGDGDGNRGTESDAMRDNGSAADGRGL